MRLLALGLFALLVQSSEAEASRAEVERIQKALAVHAGDVHGCYARALAPDMHTAGELLVRVTLGPGEAVTRAEILKDQVGSPILAACLREHMLAWNLSGIGSAGTQVVFPLIFKAAGPQRSVKLADVESTPKAPEVAAGRPPRVLPLQTWLLLDEKSVGAKRAALAVVQLGPKAKLSAHKHPASAELLFVLEGHGRLLVPGAEPEKLEPGTAAFIKAGTVHSIDDQSPQKPLRLLQAFVPPGPERVLRDRTQAQGTQVVKGTPRPAAKDACQIVREADVAPRTIAGGKGKVWILLEKASTGQDAAYLGVLEAQAGAAVPKHQHKGAAEILFLVKGKAKTVIAGQEVPADDETAIFIPEDTDHSASFSEPTRAIQLYAPAGPEQRFKPAPAPPGAPAKK